MATSLGEVERSYAIRGLELQLDTLSVSIEGERVANLTAARASSALQQLQQREGLTKDANSFVLFDIDALYTSANNVKTAFSNPGVEYLHCYAIKSCPVSFIVKFLVDQGLGMEAASYGELAQALRCGCPAEKIVYDAPCKDLKELTYALKHGVRVNVNSFCELEKIQHIMESQDLLSTKEKEKILLEIGIGVRINPLVGAGSVGILSTAVASSKFGIALTPSNEAKVIKCFQNLPYLRGVMVHVGSLGMPLRQLCDGVISAVKLANTIDKECGERRIKFIDIGGGLGVNYDSDEVKPTFDEYMKVILEKIPDFYQQNSGRMIITEFGKSLVAKTAVVISKVEDVIDAPVDIDDDANMKNKSIAIIHSGADLFLRPSYCPDKFFHRFHIFDNEFKEVDMSSREERTLTLAGPLCFSGDVLMRDKSMPRPNVGDYVCVQDAGANTISMFSHHCSRASPKILGFRLIAGEFKGSCLREQESVDNICRFWD